jgi:hypothetical protein
MSLDPEKDYFVVVGPVGFTLKELLIIMEVLLVLALVLKILKVL